METLAVETTTVLKSIAVNSAYASFDSAGVASSGTIRFYQFTYNTSSGTGFSVLNQIQRCTAKKNSSGIWVPDVCTKPTTVSWTSNTATSYERIALDSITDIVPAGAQNYAHLTVADVDNDGRDDLVYKIGVDTQCAKWVYRLSTGRGFGNAVDMNLPQTCSTSSQVGAKFLSDIFPVNLDSKGAVDFITPVMVTASGFTSYNAAFSINSSGTPAFARFNLDGLASATAGFTMTDPSLGFGELQPMVPHVLRPSIPAGQTTGSWNAYALSPNGQGGTSIAFSSSVGTYFKNWPPVFFDLNGDGYDEMVSPDSVATVFSNGSPVTVGTNLPVLRGGDTVLGRFWFMDVNGDGHRDVAYISSSDTNPGAVLRVRLNKGDFTFGPDIVNNLDPGSHIGVSGIRSGLDTGVRVADVNLDGLDDILLVDNGAALVSGNLSNGTFNATRTNVSALLSRGDGTFASALPIQPGGALIPLGDVATGYDGVPAPLQGYRLTQTLDANGDGLTDIVQMEGGKLRLYLRSGVAPELVQGIAEGNARNVSFRLASLDGGADFTLTTACREAAWPRTCGTRGFWVITALDISGPIPHSLRYSYQDPYIDRAGRGFEGFAVRTIQDLDRGSLTTIAFNDIQFFDTQTGIQPAKYFYLPHTTVTQVFPQSSGKLVTISKTQDLPVASVVDGKLIVQARTGSTIVSDCSQSAPFQCAAGNPRVLSSSNYQVSYDSYAHVVFADSATTIPGKGDEHRQKFVVYSDPDVANWLINIPNMSEDFSSMADGDSALLVTTYDTDGIRLRTRITPGNPGDEYKEERFQYDTRGRLVGITALDAPDEDEFAARQTIISYRGPGGIYPNEVAASTSINVTQSVAKTWRHPAYGYLIQQVDANNVLERQTFDTSGRQLSMTDSRSSPTTFSYGVLSNGNRWQVTSTFGNEKQIDDLDEMRRVVNHAWTDSTGATVGESRGYDVFGNLSSVKSSFTDGNYETSCGYDNLDRPTSRCMKASRTLASGTPVAPSFECVQYTYDGNKASVLSPDGVTTALTKDEAGRLVSRVRTGTNSGTTTVLTDTTLFTYGPFDQPKSVTTPAGTVSFTYDNLNRLASMSRATTTTLYGYDSFGGLVSEHHIKDPSVVGLSPTVDRFIVRDLAGRPTDDGGGTYTWDTAANGKWRLASTRSVDGVSTTHVYNANGLPATDTWTIGTESFAIDRTYDAKGRLDTLTYPVAGAFGRLVVKYAYNQFTGLVDTVTDTGTNKILYQAVTRSSAGLIRSETMNGGQVKRNVKLYEGSLVPYNITFQNGTTTTLNEDLQYYLGGNMKTRKSTLGTSILTEQMVFDGLNRVWKWTPNDSTGTNLVTYGYSLGDELATRSVSNESVTFTNSSVPGTATTNYISRLSLFNSRTSVTDTYDSDALGRTTKSPAGTFTYTPFDLPKRFVPTSGSAVDYLYDTVRGGVVKNVAGGDQEIALAGLFRRVKTGTAFSYQHALVVDGDVVGTIEHRSSGGAYANVEFYHRDQVGTLRATAANATAVARSANRDPFGNQVGTGTPFLPSDINSVAGGGFHGFQNQRHDLRAGLIDMNGRYYSPRIGRFMSNDPIIGDPMNGQTYSAKAFVFGNPTAFTDPSGFCGGPEEAPCPESGGGFGDPQGWWNAISSAGKWVGSTGSNVGSSISDGFWKTIGGLEDAYYATTNWFKEQYTSLDPPRGPSVPSAPTTPISGQSGSTTVSGGANQRSATETTTGARGVRGDVFSGDPGRLGLGGAWSPTALPPPKPHDPDAIESEWGPVLDVPLAVATGGTSLARGALVRGAERVALEEGESLVARGAARGLENAGPIARSLGAASRAEMIAKKVGLNINSPTSRQILNSLDMKVTDFIGKFRAGGIRGQFPSEFLDRTVEQALTEGGSTVRKLLTDGRFVK